jgi:hypothetical protein
MYNLRAIAKALHVEAHRKDREYAEVRQDYFRGRASEVELGFSYMQRRKAICLLHEKFVDLRSEILYHVAQKEKIEEFDMEKLKILALEDKS